MTSVEPTDHQRSVLDFMREFTTDGWSLGLTERHDGSHSVLGRMVDAGLVTVEKGRDVWTYRVV